MNRKQRRARDRALKKASKSEAAIQERIALFNKLPENCLTCLKPFDKKDKEMATTWSVVVREKEKKVNLYCPDCWDTANKVIKDFMEEK